MNDDPKPNKKQIRNSTTEFLIFSAQSGEDGLEVRYEDETIWLTQKLIARLFDVSVSTINEHLKNAFAQSEIAPEATIRKFRIVQTEGSREVARDIEHYNLDAFLEFDDRSVLADAGTITTKLAREHAESEFEKFRIKQDLEYRSDFDREVEGLESKPSPSEDA